jgi:hypothetical protein
MLEEKEDKIHVIEHQSEQKQLFWKKWFPRNRELLATVATLLGIAGAVIGLNNFIAERPNISLSSPNIQLQSIVPTDNYIKKLEAIDLKYSGFTESKISTLIDQLRSTGSTSSTLSFDPQSFYKEFDDTILYFEDLLKKDAETYELIINQLNSMNFDFSAGQALANLGRFSTILQEIETTYSQYTEDQIISLRDEVAAINPSDQNVAQKLGQLQLKLDQTILYFREKAESKNSSSIIEADALGIPGLAQELRSLQTEMKRYVEDQHEKIYIELSVANQSRLKNLIHDKAMITFFSYSDYDPSKEISKLSVPLAVISPSTIIDDYGLIKINLESKDFATLDSDRAESIRAAFKDGYRYIVVVEDLHGRLWNTDGQVVTGFSSQPEDEQRLENESEKILKAMILK